MDLYDRVQSHYEKLMTLHKALKRYQDVFVDGIGFDVQSLSSDEEDVLIGKTVLSLNVSPVIGMDRISRLLDFHGQYKVDPFVDATRFVKRMPGVLVLRSTHGLADKAISLCHAINHTRNELLADTNTIKRKEDRFKIVHDAVPGFMSEHAKREIKIIDKPVKSMSFNWACNPVPKKLERENVIARMKAAMHDSLNTPLLDAQKAKLLVMLDRVENGAYSNFQYRRESTPKPVVMTIFDDKTKKNTSIATPWILCAQDTHALPKINHLNDYAHKQTKKKVKRKDRDGIIRVQLIPNSPIYGDQSL